MTPLARQIHEEIQRDGPISFARFMELALYAPELGYYERQREIGRRGDFFTSVSTGPLFGELLAFQFAQWLGREAASPHLQIIEAGAHQGALAADILRWLQRWHPKLFARVEYVLIEPSPTRRQWQEKTLRDWLPKLKWARDIAEVKEEQSCRIIFCNEFLDAMPVHRLAWNAGEKKWIESRVASHGSDFVWHPAPVPAALARQLPEISPGLAAVLPSGYILEYSPPAVDWWKKAAARLLHGKLVTIDYGLTEQFAPERSAGTLRAYARHHVHADLLDHPGESDITAHVNFSAMESVGRSAGLITESLMEQGRFLTQILAQTESEPNSFETWTPARTKQFKTLVHPEHLGRVFRVLVQSR